MHGFDDMCSYLRIKGQQELLTGQTALYPFQKIMNAVSCACASLHDTNTGHLLGESVNCRLLLLGVSKGSLDLHKRIQASVCMIWMHKLALGVKAAD